MAWVGLLLGLGPGFGIGLAAGCRDSTTTDSTHSTTPKSEAEAKAKANANYPSPDDVPQTPPRPAWHRSHLLPRPLTNNVVIGLPNGHVFSVLGLTEGKTHADIVTDALSLAPTATEWVTHPPPPDSPGRLAATAQVVDGKVYLFGGYTVAADGKEVSLARVDVYDPATKTWSAAAPMPVAVDDSVSGVWRGRAIVLVSGWSQTDNVADVQVFEPAANRWQTATPIPGPPVFGHAGGLVGDVLVYCDGVTVHAEAPKYRATSGCFGGRLREGKDGAVDIEWTSLPEHPGAARYRIAAGSLPDRHWVIFAGGTARPYNYDGIGYDGIPAEPVTTAFAWDAKAERWVELPPLKEPRMDLRGLAITGNSATLVGGLDEERRVSAVTSRLQLPPRVP